MQLTTTRFGTLEADPGDMLLFPGGLIGFETCRHWLLLPDPASEHVAWLQAVALGHVAVPVVSPRRFVPNYKACVPRRQLAQLQLRSADEVYILGILSKTNLALTINLKSPLIINATRRIGCQAITSDDQPLAFPLPQPQISSAVLQQRRAA